MKKIVGLCIILILLLTGCSKVDFNRAYDKMQIGKNKISGYNMNIYLGGITTNGLINQSASVLNYMNKSYKINIISNFNIITYYLTDNKKYKRIRPIQNKMDKGEKKEEPKFEDTSDNIPFTNTNLYLTSLKYAKNVKKTGTKKLGSKKYFIYSYTIDKEVMNTILKDTSLYNLEYNKDIPVIVMLDNKGYVYSMEYMLNEAIGSKNNLLLSVKYTNINKASEIKIKKIG